MVPHSAMPGEKHKAGPNRGAGMGARPSLPGAKGIDLESPGRIHDDEPA